MFYRSLSAIYGQARGYRRRSIRAEATANARIPASELLKRADALFQDRLHAAIRTFPAYARKVETFRGNLPEPGECVVPSELPVWTRPDQRALFESLTCPPIRGSFAHSTGGSTGVPLRFHVTRESFEWRTAVSDRGYSWAGAEEGARSFYVWGAPVYDPGFVKRTKARLHHALQRRTYFDSFDFSEERKLECCRAINRVKPRSIVGYAGNLVELARFARDNPGRLQWRPRGIVTAAEGLMPGKREFIERHIGGEVFMSYGSREFMLIGMECGEHNGYHIASDNLYVEVADENGRPVSPGVTGRILVTDLRNAANPFVRYDTGDLGALEPPEHVCPCGLPFPVLTRVDGRMQETIRLPGGGALSALFMPHLMKEFDWVDGYQVVQKNDNEIELNLVTDTALSDRLTDPVAALLRERLGSEMVIRFRRVQSLSRNAAGKVAIVGNV